MSGGPATQQHMRDYILSPVRLTFQERAHYIWCLEHCRPYLIAFWLFVLLHQRRHGRTSATARLKVGTLSRFVWTAFVHPQSSNVSMYKSLARDKDVRMLLKMHCKATLLHPDRYVQWFLLSDMQTSTKKIALAWFRPEHAFLTDDLLDLNLSCFFMPDPRLQQLCREMVSPPQKEPVGIDGTLLMPLSPKHRRLLATIWLQQGHLRTTDLWLITSIIYRQWPKSLKHPITDRAWQAALHRDCQRLFSGISNAELQSSEFATGR